SGAADEDHLAVEIVLDRRLKIASEYCHLAGLFVRSGNFSPILKYSRAISGRDKITRGLMWQQRDTKKKAQDPLNPVYDWSTEGFDTKDLKEAKALLEELGVKPE
ncbi:MAG: hypothetical protein R3284_11825, partial [Rubricoccaceae bacterium]|nr:hypothetical protein [Rubricoccaceae bacterium]